MRSILRAILAVALLLGSGLGDWTPVSAQTPAHESCCCGMAADLDDTCPCPKPDNGPQNPRGTQGCATPGASVALATPRRATQAQRRSEPRPEPTSWTRAARPNSDELPANATPLGRAPDLGRHLAGLSLYRI